MPASGRRQLLVFGRAPVPGTVKTRLIPALGPLAATQIYTRLLAHALAVATQLEATEVTFWCQAEHAEQSACTALGARFGVAVRAQPPGSLGERMVYALREATRASTAGAVLIGSDCPAYSVAYLKAAFAALASNDGVIGPADDGGYVLIGCHGIEPRLFEAIDWSRSRVLAQTRARLRELAWRWTELPSLRAVDEPADLVGFAELDPRRDKLSP